MYTNDTHDLVQLVSHNYSSVMKVLVTTQY